MNGDELTRKIRKLYPDRKIKIIVLTADTEANASFDVGIFDGIMRKPISISELKKVLSDSPPPITPSRECRRKSDSQSATLENDHEE